MCAHSICKIGAIMGQLNWFCLTCREADIQGAGLLCQAHVLGIIKKNLLVILGPWVLCHAKPDDLAQCWNILLFLEFLPSFYESQNMYLSRHTM